MGTKVLVIIVATGVLFLGMVSLSEAYSPSSANFVLDYLYNNTDWSSSKLISSQTESNQVGP